MTRTNGHWQAFKLDELGFVGRGKSKHRPRNDPALYGGRYPFFQTGDIKAANFYLKEFIQTYNERGLAQSKLWKPGTLCITIAANIAETAILGIEGCFPDSVVGFVAHPEKADARFIKYYIDTIKLRMQSVSRGTTQDNLSLDKLLTFEFRVPALPVQRRIADILSAYDELIENSHGRIRILESMGRALYREWFVHFRFPGHEKVLRVPSPLGKIPKGWEVKKLADVAGVNRAQINARTAPEELRYIDISSVSPGQIDSVTTYAFADAPGRARRIVQHGDVLWSCVRPNRRSHALMMHPEPNTIASTGFAVLTAIGVPFTFLYFATTTDDFVAYLTNNATGAAYPAVTATTFAKAALLVPPAALLERFGEATIPMAGEINALQRKIKNLRRTRDLLLLRLLSDNGAIAKIENTL
jgi:type I restriction enzyme, S subunit